jgi:hypothetical protein
VDGQFLEGEEAGQFREWRKRKLKTKIEPKGEEECKR